MIKRRPLTSLNQSGCSISDEGNRGSLCKQNSNDVTTVTVYDRQKKTWSQLKFSQSKPMSRDSRRDFVLVTDSGFAPYKESEKKPSKFAQQYYALTKAKLNDTVSCLRREEEDQVVIS